MTLTTQQSQAEPLIEIAPPDPASIAKQLLQIQLSNTSLREKRIKILQLAVGLVNAAGVIYFEKEDDSITAQEKLISRQAESWSDDIELECRGHAQQALADEKGVVKPLIKVADVRVISCPVAESNSCLCALVFLGNKPAEPFLIILQLLATVLTQLRQPQTAPTVFNSDLTEELLVFFSKERNTWNHHQFIDQLRHKTGCSLVAVITRNGRGTMALRSITDVVKIDSRTEQSRLYLKVAQECLCQKQTLIWPGNSDQAETNTSLVLKELLRDTKMSAGAGIYLPGSGTTGAVMVLLWEKRTIPAAVEELSGLRNIIGPAVYTLFTEKTQKSPDSPRSSFPFKKGLSLLLGTILLVTLSMIQVPYKLQPQCWVEPLDVRFVVARFDGLLKDVLVEPGQHVENGESLAALDGREIQLELSSLAADIGKASKVHDSHMALGDVAMAQMASLERQRLTERQTLLAERLEKLQIYSPVEGIVLSSDLRKQKGGPVSRGQVLFEIAPLETVTLEMGIAQENVSFLQRGLPVKVTFEAYPQRVWTGEIERIGPKSQLRQGKSIFIASFDLMNNEGLLQPGMQGQAIVKTERKSLAWIYFHKPWYALRRALFSIF